MSDALSWSSSFLLLLEALSASGSGTFEELGSDCGDANAPESKDAEPTRSSPMSAVPCVGLSPMRASLPCCDVVAGRSMSVSVLSVGVVMSAVEDD